MGRKIKFYIRLNGCFFGFTLLSLHSTNKRRYFQYATVRSTQYAVPVPAATTGIPIPVGAYG